MARAFSAVRLGRALANLFHLVTNQFDGLRPRRQGTNSKPGPKTGRGLKARPARTTATAKTDAGTQKTQPPKATSNANPKSILLRQHQRCYPPSQPNQCLTGELGNDKKGG